MQRNALKRARQREAIKKENFAEEWLKENQPRICQRCFTDCNLKHFLFECGYIGKKVEYSEDGNLIMSEAPFCDISGELLTKKEIENIDFII